MIIGTDFRFNDTFNTDTAAIELLTEAYKGVIFRFTEVGIKEQDDGTAVLKFAYDILKTGEWKEDKLQGDSFFEQHLGLILNTLLIDIAELDGAARDESVDIIEVDVEG